MSESSKQVIGIDFGGTSVKLAVVEGADLKSGIEKIPTQKYNGPDLLIEAIVAKVSELRSDYPGVSAIGIGVPGAVDFATGITYNLTNVEGWTSIPLKEIMREKTGLPTVVENDANCMAFAEWKFGAGQGFTNLICLTLGTGVGGGLILNGDMYRGSQFAAGEIGQMSVDCHGVPGPYGNNGALERYIGNRQISELAIKRYEGAGQTPPDDSSPENLALLAKNGDVVALGVWKEVATYLGSCLMSCVFLLNPDAIVIGGGVAHAGDVLFDPLTEELRSSLTTECFDNLQIKHAKFGNTAGIIGSSALADELAQDRAKKDLQGW